MNFTSSHLRFCVPHTHTYLHLQTHTHTHTHTVLLMGVLTISLAHSHTHMQRRVQRSLWGFQERRWTTQCTLIRCGRDKRIRSGCQRTLAGPLSVARAGDQVSREAREGGREKGVLIIISLQIPGHRLAVQGCDLLPSDTPAEGAGRRANQACQKRRHPGHRRWCQRCLHDQG